MRGRCPVGEGELRGERLSPPWLGRLGEGRVLGLSAAPPGASWTLPGYRDPPRVQGPSWHAGTLPGSIKGPGPLSAVPGRASRWQHKPRHSAPSLSSGHRDPLTLGKGFFPVFVLRWSSQNGPPAPLFQDDAISLKSHDPGVGGVQPWGWGGAGSTRCCRCRPPAPGLTPSS